MLYEIMTRRSVRAYLPKPVSRADIELVLQAGALAPSSKNRQPWHFTATFGAAKEEALAAMKKDKLVMATLGQHVTSQYIAGKEAEWDEYRTRVSSWERDKYIINY